MVLGMTIFLVFPFTRLVHVWSGFASLVYLLRPYQLVRTRRRAAGCIHPHLTTLTSPPAPSRRRKRTP
jgi:hypothetical protein